VLKLVTWNGLQSCVWFPVLTIHLHRKTFGRFYSVANSLKSIFLSDAHRFPKEGLVLKVPGFLPFVVSVTATTRGRMRNELRQLAVLQCISQMKIYTADHKAGCRVGSALIHALFLSCVSLVFQTSGLYLSRLTTHHLKRMELKYHLLSVTASPLQP
jgi:hypothetical protein